MNRLESLVDQLPKDCQPLWWKVIHDNLKLTKHSPIAMTNWLIAYKWSRAVSEYQLEAGLKIAIQYMCNTRNELAKCIHEPASIMGYEEYYAMKAKDNSRRSGNDW